MLYVHYTKSHQSSRKRRITRIGTHVFSLGRMIFAKRESRVRIFFGTRDLFNISYSRELYLFSKFLHFEEIVRAKMAVCFEMIVSET